MIGLCAGYEGSERRAPAAHLPRPQHSDISVAGSRHHAQRTTFYGVVLNGRGLWSYAQRPKPAEGTSTAETFRLPALMTMHDNARMGRCRRRQVDRPGQYGLPERCEHFGYACFAEASNFYRALAG